MTDDGDLVLRSTIRQYWYFILGAAASLASGVFLVEQKGDSVGWLAVSIGGFFLLPIAVAIATRPTLTVDGEGFAYRFGRLRKAYRWNDVGTFSTGSPPGWWWAWPKSRVYFERAPHIPATHPRGNRVFRAVTGHDDSLPDNFGLSASALAAVLNQRRERVRGVTVKTAAHAEYQIPEGSVG